MVFNSIFCGTYIFNFHSALERGHSSVCVYVTGLCVYVCLCACCMSRSVV